MKKRKKSYNRIFVIISVIVLCLTISSIITLGGLYFFPKLNSFEITGISEDGSNLYLNTTKCYNATNYNLKVYDSKNDVILEKNSKTNKIDISDLILSSKQKVTFEVSAKNRKSEVIKANNKYEYINDEASFAKTNNHLIQKDISIPVYIVNMKKGKKYSVKLFHNNKEIKHIDVTGEKINIIYDELKEYEGKITLKLYNEHKRIISKRNIYLNTIEIDDLKIIKPVNEFQSIWDDIHVSYIGGNNASTLTIRVYNKKKKMIYSSSKEYDSEEMIVPASVFKENERYRIELVASYNDYYELSKYDSTMININEKESVKPVYVNKNFTFAKKGTKVTLATDTPGAKIYYTLDGTKPNQNSFEYSEPIVIGEDTQIKTYAVRNNMFDSEINEYNYVIKDKKPVIYLSPSNQYSNYGVRKAGYTTEKNEMNDLTNYIIKYLKEAGVTVYRNNKAPGGMNTWLAESNNKKTDFHFAIHSNGSVAHDKNGMEMYVDTPTSKSLSIASTIYKNLYSIYPYKSEESDRGVKFANGSLGEANEKYHPCSALIEVAFHDNYNDAKWIMENKDSIAKNIADSILSFYYVNE